MEENSSRRFLFISIGLGFLILAGGTAGYSLIEGWDLLDSLYMTVITMATIGYGEVRPLSPTGRVFTLFVIIFGVGNAAYLVGLFTRAIIEGSLRRVLGRRKLEKQIKAIRDHYIICGYGRIGRVIAREISAGGQPLVVVESNPDTIESIELDGHLYVVGEATDDGILMEAGIKQARGLISVVNSDADNVYIVLSARALNEDLTIIARASREKTVDKLKRAGADRVVSPYHIGARKMAQAVLRPTIADFIETTVHGGDGMDLAMEEIIITEDSKLKDVALIDSGIRRDLNVIVIAIKKDDGEMLFNPSAESRINVGDILIAVGERQNMNKLATILGANSSNGPFAA